MNLEITPIPCLSDNYAYLLVSDGQVAVVDPSEAEPVLRVLEQRGLTPHMILNTHHHWDHVGGNKALLEQFPDVSVYGHESDAERIPGLTHGLQHEASFSFGKVSVRVLHNPGHTHGAITYVMDQHAFTGDTLFGAGCGRVFEGTMPQMYESLNQVLGELPEDTLLYYGHEYTAANLRFAQAVEPHNKAMKHRAERPLERATLKTEKDTNPFLRCHEPVVIQAAETQAGAPLDTPAKVFGALRRWKDQF